MSGSNSIIRNYGKVLQTAYGEIQFLIGWTGEPSISDVHWLHRFRKWMSWLTGV